MPILCSTSSTVTVCWKEFVFVVRVSPTE
ncbi:hypothetical protein EG68_12161 [Paragonimus skrjabini miyazakii]|uniref:Uncharacterized protein n=1 Tax=Paragonimus skrjabini miyazakii TaxID=59628 RepID=A0A8S9YRF2_9TREM|nr:hypothetical protein EG68_12161 [Paragonimus skrjabini miyazakii]